jgi:hypothetical protein
MIAVSIFLVVDSKNAPLSNLGALGVASLAYVWFTNNPVANSNA